MNNKVTPMPQPQVNMQAIVKQLETAPFEVCGAEPEQQAYKQEGTCTSREFTKIFMYKILSALVSPTGRDKTIEMQLIKCVACGAHKVVDLR